MENRISKAINQTGEQIVNRVKSGLVTEQQISALHCKLDIAFDEFVSFQELKSIAMLHKKLSLEEAQTVYGYLGESPERFNAQPIGVKVVLTKVFSELLSWKIGLQH